MTGISNSKFVDMQINIFFIIGLYYVISQLFKLYFQSWGNYAQTFMKNFFPNIRYKMIYNIILQSVEKLNDFRIDLSRMNLKSSINQNTI